MDVKGVTSPQSGGTGSWKVAARRWRRGVPLLVVALIATACSSTSNGASPGGSSSLSCSSGGTSQGTGVTSKCITVGQVDDLTLPLPGLFKGAEDGTQAYIDYTNSLGGVNGRKIKLDAEDSAFQGGQVASETAAQIQHDFALVGGFSLLDSSEQPFIDAARLPDVGFSLSPSLSRDVNLYSPLPNPIGYYPLGVFKYLKKRYPQAVKHVGIIWENATASTKSSEDAFEAAMKSQGFKILYDRGAGPFDTNFLSDILAMKNANVQMFFALELPDNYAAELATQFQQQNFKPINIEGAAYSNQLVSLGGSAVNNVFIEQAYALYLGQDANTVPAVKLFDTWMKKADPKANFEIESVYGWASAELFVQALRQAGNPPTRSGLRAALDKVTSFDAGGLTPPGNPAQAIPSDCFLMAQVQNGQIKRVAPSPPTGFYCPGGGYFKEPGYTPMVRPAP